MDQLTSMKVFVRVVAARSFARTAEQLDMSRAMVTTHVAALERRLGVRLLHRTTRRLSLTEEGRAYHERCIRILEDVEEAGGLLSRSQAVARGRLRVQMPITFARWIMPALTAVSGAVPGSDLGARIGQPHAGSVWRRF